MTSDLDTLFATLHAWRQESRPAALATVVRTWGSSPRPEGSLLAVDDSGRFVGSVSGGCIEGAVIEAAYEVMREGKPRLLEYGVSDERAWEVGLACGGRVQVLIEAIDAARHEALQQIGQALAQRRTTATVTRLADGAQAILTGDTLSGPLTLGEEERAAALAHLASERSALLAGDALFVRAYVPPPRLIVIGAVHIAQALAPMARIAGFEPVVIDPRGAFAAPERFPGVRLISEWPDAALDTLGLDAATAIAALSHDPKLDDPALQRALPSAAFYVGALGSKRTHEKRLQRLREAGLDAWLARIHSPIGLDLGGRAPAEIAVAILGQIIQIRHGGGAR